MRRRLIEFSCILLACFGVSSSAPGGERTGSVSPRVGEYSLLVVAEALSWKGSPYRFGGHTRQGVDCSGFVHEVLLASQVPGALPRRSDSFLAFGKSEEGDIEPGDILLFGADEKVTHVGIALSSDTFIHAASEGTKTGVIISSLSEGGWKARLVSARRIEEGGK